MRLERTLGADQIGGEGAIEAHAACLQKTAGRVRFLDPFLGEIRVFPAGEEILQIPFALAVPHEDEKTLHGSSCNSDMKEQSAARPSPACGRRRAPTHKPALTQRPQDIGHGIKARLAAARPKCRMQRAAGENSAILGAMNELQPFARTGEDHHMIADHRAAAQRGKTDAAFAAARRYGRRGCAPSFRRDRRRGRAPPPRPSSSAVPDGASTFIR